MGYGVGDDETFPRLLEDRLNARRRPGGPRYEVLNFGTGKSYAIHRHVLIDRKVFGFEPDAIFYVAHQDEFLGPVQHLAKLVARNGHDCRTPAWTEVVRKAGVTPETSWGMTEALLQPLAPEIVRRGVPGPGRGVPAAGDPAGVGLPADAGGRRARRSGGGARAAGRGGGVRRRRPDRLGRRPPAGGGEAGRGRTTTPTRSATG